MSFKDFFWNGGIMGAMRGFDREKEGHAYGFREFGEDIQEAGNCANAIGAVGRSLSKTKTDLLGGIIDGERE